VHEVSGCISVLREAVQICLLRLFWALRKSISARPLSLDATQALFIVPAAQMGLSEMLCLPWATALSDLGKPRSVPLFLYLFASALVAAGTAVLLILCLSLHYVLPVCCLPAAPSLCMNLHSAIQVIFPHSLMPLLRLQCLFSALLVRLLLYVPAACILASALDLFRSCDVPTLGDSGGRPV